MAANDPSRHDYTEGASAIEIRDTIARTSRARRDSQYNLADGGEGTMFDGPGSMAIPTSTSRMSYTDRGVFGRRSSEYSRRRSEEAVSLGSTSRGKRRMSTSSQISWESASGTDESAAEDEGEGMSTRRAHRTRRSPSPARNRSVFDNIAHLFSKTAGEPSERRPSLSARSSLSSTRPSRRSRLSDAGSEVENETEERWGYSSGEEDDSVEALSVHPPSGLASDVEYGSRSPSPSRSTLPLLSSDPIFGDEVRIDIDAPLEPLEPPPPGPPSRQKIYVSDEDSTVLFVGYEIILWRQWVWRLLCVLSLGMLRLLGHWFPRLWLRWVVREKAFKDLKQGFVAIEVRMIYYSFPTAANLAQGAYRAITLFPVKHIAYPYEHSTVFPNPPDLEGPSRHSPPVKSNGQDDHKSEIIGDLLIVDYRYSRFALDPQTGLFRMLKYWPCSVLFYIFSPSRC